MKGYKILIYFLWLCIADTLTVLADSLFLAGDISLSATGNLGINSNVSSMGALE
ncbi:MULTISPECIES: hypothetical protein [unclassified Coleofasciculus]|uniref:hypothetical protein n=1 Tax=unclassified Coleofasciculus TaxID=2692782 RepID=UPI0018809F76|nr:MULTISPECIES: hypothetical protein [unclassified Coleofasciculus]MBE9126198.1 hypothetical protein [Coleofasciculus sp. LEGE 07081]MBE9149595.1 hypothetical protein [Coleofasciculus sp. LEGE 07092]